MLDENIRLREEVFRQIEYLDQLKQMAAMYGYDISEPASNAQRLCNGCISPILRP